MKQCEICKEEFLNHAIYANHIRHKHKSKEFYEKVNLKLSLKRQEQKTLKYGSLISKTKYCKFCKSEFTIMEREFIKKTKKFCSISCANSGRVVKEENKLARSRKSSLAQKKNWANKEYREKALQRNGKRYFTSKGETEVVNYFKENFPNDEWTTGGSLKLKEERLVRDLYSNKLKICIEYDGIWHFKDIHGQLEGKVLKDNLLEEWCLENNYRLIRIKEDVYKKNPKEVLKLLENIVYKEDCKIKKLYD